MKGGNLLKVVLREKCVSFSFTNISCSDSYVKIGSALIHNQKIPHSSINKLLDSLEIKPSGIEVICHTSKTNTIMNDAALKNLMDLLYKKFSGARLELSYRAGDFCGRV